MAVDAAATGYNENQDGDIEDQNEVSDARRPCVPSAEREDILGEVAREEEDIAQHMAPDELSTRDVEDRAQQPAAAEWSTFSDTLNGGQSDNVADQHEQPMQEFGVEDLLDKDPRDCSSELFEFLCSSEAALGLLQRAFADQSQHVGPEMEQEMPTTLFEDGRQTPGANSDGVCGTRPQHSAGTQTAAAEVLLLATTMDRFVDVLAHSETALEFLWDIFLDTAPPLTTAPVLATLFCNLATPVLQRHPEAVARVLRRRDPDVLLSQLLARLEHRSFAELLVLLLCAEMPSRVIVPASTLALMFAFVGRDGSSQDALEHAVFVIDAMIAHACAGLLVFANDLLRQLAVPDVVGAFIDRVVDCAQPPVAVAVLSVLSSAVSHLHFLARDPLLPARSPEHEFAQSTAGHRPRSLKDAADGEAAAGSSVAAEGFMDAFETDLDFVGGALVEEICSQLLRLCASCLQSEHAFATDTESGMHSCGEFFAAMCILEKAAESSPAEAEWLTPVNMALATLCAASPGTVQVLETHGWATDHFDELPDMRSLLADLKAPPPSSRPVVRDPTVGVMLEAIGLLLTLAKTKRAVVYRTFLDAKVLHCCLVAMLTFEWNSVLHNAVRGLFLEVYGNRDHGAAVLLALVEDKSSFNHVVTAFRREEALDVATGDYYWSARRQPNVGYMSHLRAICMDLVDLSEHVPDMSRALAEIEGWSDVVKAQLHAVLKIQVEPLGGAMPTVGPAHSEGVEDGGANVERCDILELVRAAPLDVKLSPEDLFDIHESFDVRPLVKA